MTNTTYIKHIINTITDRANGFLESEIELDIEKREFQVLEGHQFNLKMLTSLMNISIGNDINVNIAFSFEDKLIDKIFKVYSEELEIEDDEYDEYIEETAADIINIIIGNATADLQNEGKVINISVPIVTHEAKSISRDKNLDFYSTHLYTNYGKMRITAVSFSKNVNH